MHPFKVTIVGTNKYEVIVKGFTESEIYELDPHELLDGTYGESAYPAPTNSVAILNVSLNIEDVKAL
jgi:hypothetical protein